jgi:hypothetical protein
MDTWEDFGFRISDFGESNKKKVHGEDREREKGRGKGEGTFLS